MAKNITDRKTAKNENRWYFAISKRFLTCFMLQIIVCLQYALFNSMPESVYQKMEQPEPLVSHCMNKTVPLPRKIKTVTLFDWQEDDMSLADDINILSTIPTGLLFGYLSDRYGGKLFVEIAVLGCSCVHLITPPLTEWCGGNIYLFYILRGLAGAFRGGFMPAVFAIVSGWCPPRDSGFLGGLVFSGIFFGNSLDDIATTEIILYTNYWGAAFYAYSILSLLWVLFWHFCSASIYKKYRWISQKELKYLNKYIGDHVTLGKKIIPWQKFVTSIAMVSFVLVAVTVYLFTVIVENRYHFYMQDILLTNVKDSKVVIGRVFALSGFVIVIFGLLEDICIKKGHINTLTARKMLTTLGNMGGPMFFVMSTLGSCSKLTFVLMSSVGLVLLGLSYIGVVINIWDFAPNFAGTARGIISMFAVSISTLLLYCMNIYTNGTLKDWGKALWICIGTYAVTNLIFVIFATTDIQRWNEPRFKDPISARPSKTGSKMSTSAERRALDSVMSSSPSFHLRSSVSQVRAEQSPSRVMHHHQTHNR